ncbi:MAG: ABC transporter permease [Candidatus Diapherotrites archaeon]
MNGSKGMASVWSRLFSVRRKIPARLYWTLVFGSFALVFLLWAAVAFSGIVKPLFLPSPGAVLEAGIRLFSEGKLLSAMCVSTYRVLLGFWLAVLIGVPIGILIGNFDFSRAFLGPLMTIARYFPVSAIVPLSILWLGIGDAEKVFILFIGIVPYLAILVADSVAKVKRVLLDVAVTLGAKRKQLLFKVIIPAALPDIYDGIRVSAAIGWTYLIVAELIASQSGLGYIIIQAQRYLHTPDIFVAVIVIALLALATDLVLALGYRKLFPWSEKGEENE